MSVGKCNEPALEVVVAMIALVLVVMAPACTVYSVTFPHASATILQTKKQQDHIVA